MQTRRRAIIDTSDRLDDNANRGRTHNTILVTGC